MTITKSKSDNNVEKEKSQDFQEKIPEKDPDLKAMIADLTKTVQELVKDNQLRKQQEAQWVNQWQPYQPYQPYLVTNQ